VCANAVLGGTGTIWRTVNVASNGVLAPGNPGAVGTLTVASNLDFAAGAVYNWHCCQGSGDTVVVRGALALPARATVNVTSLGGEWPAYGVIFRAGQLAGETGDLTGWTLNMPVNIYRLQVVGQELRLVPRSGGASVLMR
jgi:hypothetical protein